MSHPISRGRRALIAQGGALAAAPLLGIRAGNALAQAQKPRTMTWTVSPEPPLLVAALSSAAMVQEVSPKMLEGLVVYNKSLEPRPALATSWTIDESGN